MKIGSRIYYDRANGEVIEQTSQREGLVKHTTIEQDIITYKSLSERNRETFDYIELEYGQYAQDFAECNGYKVNPETKELEFSYPDPNEAESQEPVYQKPLSEQVREQESAIGELTAIVSMLMMGGV